MRTVFVDLDSTAADLITPWLQAHFESTGERLTTADLTEWDTAKASKFGAKVFEPLARPGFFRNLPPMPGAIENLKRLKDAGFHIVILTKAFLGNGDDKLRWVEEHLPFIGWQNVTLVHSHDGKGYLRGDALIDDGPHNIELFRKRNPSAGITGISFPYNQSALKHGAYLAEDWRDPEVAWDRMGFFIRYTLR